MREQAAAACRAACRSATRGCPLGNLIPDWNDLVHRGSWQEASERLHSTNSFPELTGKLCPAPCEEACVLDDQRRRRDDQGDRVGDRRARLGGGLDRPAARRRELRPHGRRDRLGAGGPRRGPAARARRARGDGLRARRPPRRPAALRHPRLQAREDAHRPPRRAARRRGRRVRLRRRRRRRGGARRAARAPRRDRARDRRPAAPRAHAARRGARRACTSRWTTSCSRTGASPVSPWRAPS